MLGLEWVVAAADGINVAGVDSANVERVITRKDRCWCCGTVVTDGVVDGPCEVLVDELLRILPEILFADFVFSPEKDRFDVSRDTACEFVTECFDRSSSHVS